MAYDIPDEIKYKEKIVANLDTKQLLYAIAFGVLALLTYNLPIEGELRLVLPGTSIIIGVGFVFLKMEDKVLDVLAYYINIRNAPNNSKKAQKFFEVKTIENDFVHLDNGKILAILEISPINFELLDESRKKVLLANYTSFLNQLAVPIQILVRTKPINLKEYFKGIESKEDKREDILKLYADFRVFEEDFIDVNQIKERFYYIIIPFNKTKTLIRKDNGQEAKQLNEIVKVMQEKLTGCGLNSRRLLDKDLLDFYLTYADSQGDAEIQDSELEPKEESKETFRNILTPSFGIERDYSIINNEFHRIVKVNGYPRKVENGWLQNFLSINENYDISVHITPSTIRYMLVYLHNQIIQQTSDLIMSTVKGTPNPSLEIKKADTMKVYDSLYKGEEKMFSVSVYIDNKGINLDELDLLTEKCKSNLNAQLMVPEITHWRMADGIKSTLPVANNKLQIQRDFLTNSLAATFPFISPIDTKKEGILFAHEADTLNPIFIDMDKMSNKHFFIIGISGSGKSYTSKYMIIQQLFKEDSKIYILDPNGEYSSLCRALGGHLVKLSRESESIINIFDLAGEDFGNKMLSLVSVFDLIVGGLTESQKAVLNKALIKVYEKKGIIYDKPETWNKQSPTFTDFKKVLSKLRRSHTSKRSYVHDVSFEVLINRVQMYCKKGIFGFLDRQSKINIEKDFVCFDLSELPVSVKNLMMFSTLELIQRETKKDKKAKLILIDEGWSLLRSKESSNYILDFIKTSRKFNASLGFVTQEIEDLLMSNIGKSILNTASVKILMRQNPSNMGLISNNLNLNENARNYLLTAQNGFGLLITDQNNYKFVIKTSDKIHKLITTDPKEFKEPEKPEKVMVKKKKKPKISLKRGLYLKSNLNDEKVAYLLANSYVLHKDRFTKEGASSWYLVKKRHGEGVEHAFFCWSIRELLKKYKFKKIKLFKNKGGDVVAETDNSKIAFEVETGENIRRYNEEMFKQKFEKVKEEFDNFYIVVTSRSMRNKYKNFGKVLTRNEVEDITKKIREQ